MAEQTEAQTPPFRDYAMGVIRVCHNSRTSRARLRRAVNLSDEKAWCHALSILARWIPANFQRDRPIGLAIGVAGLYAKHGEGKIVPWKSVGEALAGVPASAHDRAAEELERTLATTEWGALIRRIDRCLSFSKSQNPSAVNGLDWGWLLSNVLSLTSGDTEKRKAVRHRWARDYAQRRYSSNTAEKNKDRPTEQQSANK